MLSSFSSLLAFEPAHKPFTAGLHILLPDLPFLFFLRLYPPHHSNAKSRPLSTIFQLLVTLAISSLVSLKTDPRCISPVEICTRSTTPFFHVTTCSSKTHFYISPMVRFPAPPSPSCSSIVTPKVCRPHPRNELFGLQSLFS